MRGGWRGLRDHMDAPFVSHGHVLSGSPPVFYLWWEGDHQFLHHLWKGKPLIILYLFPWCTYLEDVPSLSATVRKRLLANPGHRIILLCNEEHTVEPFRQQGVEAIFCNQNAFINENVFKPIDSEEKQFDAVYSASMTPYKRFELAAEVGSLMILTYRWAGHYRSDYEKDVRAILNRAVWRKDTYSDDQKVTSCEMVRLYSQARVGLCLSKTEGGMFASMEYLLCGLPVVTTQSVGGRDAFWDQRYVKIVEDDPRAVAQGVADLVEMRIPAELIHNETLKKIEPHRKRLRDYLAGISQFDIPWVPGAGGGIMDAVNLKSLSLELKRMCK